jgi:hypothetical protein
MSVSHGRGRRRHRRGIGCSFNSLFKELAQVVQRQSQHGPAADNETEFVDELAALLFHSPPRGIPGDERTLAVPHIQKAVRHQPLIDPQDRVLIDGQFLGELPHRGQPVACFERAGCAQRCNLLGDLP